MPKYPTAPVPPGALSSRGRERPARPPTRPTPSIATLVDESRTPVLWRFGSQSFPPPTSSQDRVRWTSPPLRTYGLPLKGPNARTRADVRVPWTLFPSRVPRPVLSGERLLDPGTGGRGYFPEVVSHYPVSTTSLSSLDESRQRDSAPTPLSEVDLPVSGHLSASPHTKSTIQVVPEGPGGVGCIVV